MDDNPEDIIVDVAVLARNKANLRILYAQNMYSNIVEINPQYELTTSYEEFLQKQFYPMSGFNRRWRAAFLSLDDTSYDSQLALLFVECGILIADPDNPENLEEYVPKMKERLLKGTFSNAYFEINVG